MCSLVLSVWIVYSWDIVNKTYGHGNLNCESAFFLFLSGVYCHSLGSCLSVLENDSSPK